MTYFESVKRGQVGTLVVRWGSVCPIVEAKKIRRVNEWRDIEKLARAFEAKEQRQEAIAKCVA